MNAITLNAAVLGAGDRRADKIDARRQVNEVCYLQRDSTAEPSERRSIRSVTARFAVLFATLGAAVYCPAQHTTQKPDSRLDEVVINAARIADEQVTQQVQKTLTEDPWIFSEHITVTTHNGVVRLEGIVGDTGEWFRVLRLARKIPGARRVVTDLEIVHNDPDGG